MRRGMIMVLPALAALAACSSGSGPAEVVNGSGTSGQFTRPSSFSPGAVAEGPADSGIGTATAEWQQAASDRIFFSYNQTSISPEARLVLERQAAFMKRYPQLLFTIEGHADERGTREYNLALGDRRARATEDMLMALGIPAARFTTISYGKERPAVPGDYEAAWAQNRRAVTVIQ